MEANELRIGNLVNYQGDNWNMSSIFKDDPLELVKNGTYKIANISEFQPIELTEELLLNFGFKWKNNGLRKSNFCLRNFGSSWSIFLSNESFNFNVELKYFHELQNLYFYITGVEINY